MKLTLTNDDGYGAPGLVALAEVANMLGDVTVIAPRDHLSGCSHRVTYDRPFGHETRDGRHYAVDGTPADCVRMMAHHLAPGTDFVLSGINAGGNLGADALYSGTVAAAREAALYGYKAIALSHYRKKGRDFDWPRAVRWVRPIIEELMRRAWKPREFYSINLPHPADGEADPEVVECPLDVCPMELRYAETPAGWEYQGVYEARPREPGTDVEVCFGGKIALTRLTLPGM